MKEQFSEIKTILSSEGSSEVDRIAALEKLKDIEKALTLADFKLVRCSREKYAISKLLEETIEELQNKTIAMIQTEKMAALGQLVAGVAHEVNTPLGAISSSIQNIIDAQVETLDLMPTLFQTINDEEIRLFLSFVNSATQSKSNLSSREERALKRLFRSELDEIGVEDTSNIADVLVDIGFQEIDKKFIPLFKSEHSDLLLRSAYAMCIQSKNGDNIKLAVGKASKIVFALKTYGRQSDTEEKTRTNIIDSLETILTLYQNQLKQGIEVVKNFEPIPDIMAFSDQLNQVWTNVVHNALQAMENKGTLTINVSQVDNNVVVEIRDSGSGMPPEVMERIFQPFFTTKPAGEGSGLGLDIVNKIIEKHDGKISVTSVVDEGTTFKFELPIFEV